MKPITRWSVLALATVIALIATPALALIPCEDCEPDMPVGTRCVGICDGMLIRYCHDWFVFGCSSSLSPAETQTGDQTEERFIRSLQFAPAEKVPAGASGTSTPHPRTRLPAECPPGLAAPAV